MRSGSKIRRYSITAIVVFGIAVACAGSVAVCFRIIDQYNPTISAIEAITEGMSKEEVIESLGALYDGIEPGQYQETDRRLKERGLLKSATYIQCYSVAGTRRKGWVVYGMDDLVAAVWTD